MTDNGLSDSSCYCWQQNIKQSASKLLRRDIFYHGNKVSLEVSKIKFINTTVGHSFHFKHTTPRTLPI
jgi:hypothetical protein